ncbi:MAG: putative capsular polysaccharide synthesis family protein [Candidatus Binatia bacterium]
MQQPVVVYQMGMVGSTSIVEALTAIGLPVFHLHALNPAHLMTVVEKHQEKGIPLPAHIHQAFKVKKKLLDEGKPVKIITAVRDPIARNISAYFQALRFFRALKPEFEEGELETMMTEFLNKYQHHLPLIWFDREIKEVLGLDIYNYPFPKNDGVQRIRETKIDVLLLKAETADHLKIAVIREFLQIPEFSLKAKNVGKKKAYAHYYKPFLERIQLPAAYLDKMYGSRYVQHFYSPEEIHEFRKRWTGGRMSSERNEAAQNVS